MSSSDAIIAEHEPNKVVNEVFYSKITHTEPVLISTPSRQQSSAIISPTATPVANVTLPENIEISKIYKILIVGNAKCGKSSIITKYAYKTNIDGKYKTTIGADFVRKDIMVDLANRNPIGVRLQLWDIAGQDRFQKLTRAYFSKARGVAIVCDVSREGTIDAIKSWKAEIDNWSDQANCKDIPVVLFANKADLLDNAQGALKTGATMERICRELGFVGWWVTSAKTGECLDEAFNALVRSIIAVDEKKELSSLSERVQAKDSPLSSKNTKAGVIRLSFDNDRIENNDEDGDDYVYYRPRRFGGDCC